jgi:hypothetical protein
MSTNVKSAKPHPAEAMSQLICQVRSSVPFDIPADQLCAGPCRGCPKKLLEFLDMELEEWEQRLDDSEQPSLGDIQRLAKRSRKIYCSLEKNGLISQ